MLFIYVIWCWTDYKCVCFHYESILSEKMNGILEWCIIMYLRELL